LPRATACGFFRFLSMGLIIRARLRTCKRIRKHLENIFCAM
jgi:hypothetical protein